MYSKMCRKCNKIKTSDNFPRHKKTLDGFDSWCKSCRNQYNALRNRDNVKLKIQNKEYLRLYRKTEKAKFNRKNRKNPEKLRSQHAVAGAVTNGDLLAISDCLCLDCKKQAEHYHHPSYKKSDRLVVVPLCRDCHAKRHRKY